jgi:hypothetical protein
VMSKKSKPSDEASRPLSGRDLSWVDELNRVWTKPSDIFKPGYSDPCPPELQKIRPQYCWPTKEQIEAALKKSERIAAHDKSR